jgi:hypothetical protein
MLDFAGWQSDSQSAYLNLPAMLEVFTTEPPAVALQSRRDD